MIGAGSEGPQRLDGSLKGQGVDDLNQLGC